MNNNATMAEFAESLWQNYIKPKITQEFNSTVSYFKATVKVNNGDGTLDIQRPFDSIITVQAAKSVENIVVGKTVTVLQFGKGNSQNYIAIGEGNPRDAFGGGGGSAITYTLSISGNVITLTGSDSSTSSITLPVYNGGVTP